MHWQAQVKNWALTAQAQAHKVDDKTLKLKLKLKEQSRTEKAQAPKPRATKA